MELAKQDTAANATQAMKDPSAPNPASPSDRNPDSSDTLVIELRGEDARQFLALKDAADKTAEDAVRRDLWNREMDVRQNSMIFGSGVAALPFILFGTPIRELISAALGDPEQGHVVSTSLMLAALVVGFVYGLIRGERRIREQRASAGKLPQSPAEDCGSSAT